MDTKPTFILFCGIGWCGTTSLWHTLKNNNYIHTGWYKETGQLLMIEGYEDYGYLDPDEFISYNKLNKIPLPPPKFNINYSEEKIEYLDPLIKCEPKIKLQNDILTIDTEDRIPSIYSSKDYNKAFENYVEYYRKLSTAAITEGNYQVVGDFSNSNVCLSEYFLNKLKNTLGLHFNIKVMFMFRDPVRRLFSNINSSFYVTRTRISPNDYPSATEYYVNFLNTINLYKIPKIDYCEMIQKFERVFGKENLCYLIMEDLFKKDNSEEVKKLEQFIDYKLNEIFPCAFVPDRGINAPKLEKLDDQWDSDHEILTEELYKLGREKLSFVYDTFEKLHGFLPADWGAPIDYGY